MAYAILLLYHYQEMPPIKNQTDEDLINGLRLGSEEAYLEIFNRYWLRLYNAACTKLQSHDEAEEVVQNLFIKIWNNRESLFITNLQAYLFTALRRRILNHVKPKVSSEAYWEYCKKYLPNQERTTEEMVIFNELRSEIEIAVNQLPEKSRQVFRLNKLEGKSVSEIAIFLNLSERAIEYHLTKSTKALRLYLKDFVLSLPLYLLFY